jgi:hypothetical protein
VKEVAHVRVWKFRPPPGREAEFAEAYSGSGRWAKLFGRGKGYLGTVLLGPAETDGWWLTLDRWESPGHFAAFHQQFGHEYRSLDAELEGLAGEEEFVGAFEEDEQ